MRTSALMPAWALGLALMVPPPARAEVAAAPPPELRRTDLTPAALQQASALVESYLQPIAEPPPTPRQKRAIESAIKLLKSEQGTKEQYAIEQFLKIGPAALGDLRRLASSKPPETAGGGISTADAYAATMAPIIIRRIETAQRQAIVEELISLGDEASVVLAQKLQESQSAVTKAEVDVEAASEALAEASAKSPADASAAAGERRALAEAEAAEKQAKARQGLLMEINRLMTSKPVAQPPAAPQEPPPEPPTPPADVLSIQPISPPTGPTGSVNTPLDWSAMTTNSYDDWGNLSLFGGSFELWRHVHDYSHRGADSRGTAHPGGGPHNGGGGKEH